jgi:uncharacterized membrane protein YphA (DoxX/SURF4 family)
MKAISIGFSRFFVGFLFIFSGLIKANDPLGFGYKLQEYFEVFHITFFNDYATAIAIFLCGLEIILGAALLLGIYAKKVIWGLLALIVFFTFLTFYSAYFEVVTSCGCFGDAIPLTPWQSFGKDLILLALILILFIYRAEIKSIVPLKNQNLILAVCTLLGFGVGIYTYRNLPFIDFLPYKVGANVTELMKIPPGAPQDEYEIVYQLKNKKTGEVKKMTDKAYLKEEIWKDTNWEVLGEPESKLLKKGFEPKIKDLKIMDAAGEDFTISVLEHSDYHLMIVAYDLDKTNPEALKSLNEIALKAIQEYRIPSAIFTASDVAKAYNLRRNLFIDMPFFFADAIPLKSMVRANPGIMLMKNGVILNKWHYQNMPAYEDLVKKYFKK